MSPVEYTTTVKLHLDDAPNEWISSAIIYLFDRDRLTRDDFLGMEITNSYGEATFRFRTRDFLDFDERLGGALPELYVEVYGRDDRLVLSTRAVAQRNAVPSLIRVGVDRELAREHGLV